MLAIPKVLVVPKEQAIVLMELARQGLLQLRLAVVDLLEPVRLVRVGQVELELAI